MPAPSALINEAMAAAARKDYARAIDLLAAALKAAPDASLFFNRAVMLQQLGRHREAVSDYTAALRLRRDDLDALFNRAVSFDALGETGNALLDYEAILARNARHAPALLNRGRARAAKGAYAEALADFERVAEINPRHAGAHYNAGEALRDLERHEDAIAAFDRALAIDVNHANAWNNRGLALEALDRAAEAVASYDQALARGRTAERLTNRGSALIAQNKAEEALACYDTALALGTDNPEIRLSRAGALLALGRYEEGFADYEARWRSSGGPIYPSLASPRWDGTQELAGRSIMLHAEQGLGDTLQFARFAAPIAARGAAVHLRVQTPLRDLLHESMRGVESVTGFDDPLPPTDFHLPLMSTPLALRTAIDTIPTPQSYLAADPARVIAWRDELGDGPLVGLAWRGDLRRARFLGRTAPLETLAPLLETGRRFVSLQIDSTDEERALLARHDVTDFGERLRDFRDHTALTATCALVITIDTVVAHLAGALGKTAWIMLPFSADWRWLIAREDSPWYPRARLFRQSAPGDWSGVAARIGEALRSAEWL
jgi:tetratricopeptide (TPR) repeat protein